MSDPATWAEIDTNAPQPESQPGAQTAVAFDPSVLAMVVDEAFGGCGLVLLQTSNHLQKGDLCRVRIGEFGPLLAEVRWREDVAPEVARCGVQFLE